MYVCLQNSQPIRWMEGPSRDALRQAETNLSDCLWMSGQVANLPDGDRLAPTVWEAVRTSMGRLLDYAAERIESTRYWASSLSHPPSTTPAPGPSTSRDPVPAACPICFEQATQVLRPCGHVICAQCVVNVARCPICKKGFFHTIKVFFI